MGPQIPCEGDRRQRYPMRSRAEGSDSVGAENALEPGTSPIHITPLSAQPAAQSSPFHEVDFRAFGTKVALVNMPFSSAKYPSIQLGSLSALLKSRGIGVKSHHLNLVFAHKIGTRLYEVLCEKRGLFGEWLFSSILFRDNPKHAEYPRVFKPVFEDAAREAGCPVGYLEDIERRVAPQFLTWALAHHDWGQYAVVGFTSTFDQNVASLTMAKLIKDLYPDVRIVFGGANCDGEMGLAYSRAPPSIDYVVVGEGEKPFPALVQGVLTGQEDSVPPGVAFRREGRIHLEPNRQLFEEFHSVGPPDYDDFFEQLQEVAPQESTGLNRILLYEGSRGCWWGEKHHCTFCGLNAQAMRFRSKSAEQVAKELDYLSSRYNATRFRMVDNIIEMAYIDGLFGRLADEHYDLDVFVETKSNLSKRQIQTLARGGVKCMQPGIESLSATQLKEMDKGVSPLQNIQCLKWSRYYDIDISWNILLGFPQESDEDYQRQIELIPSLLHLQPPAAVGKLWLERFSPYFVRPAQYGVRITGPGTAYAFVYDEREVDLNKIAYDFEYEVDWTVDPRLYDELLRVASDWKAKYFSDNRPFLYYAKAMSYVMVYDGRAGTPRSERFDWPAAYIIDFCNEAPKTLDQIKQGLQQQPDRMPSHAAEPIEEVVRCLVTKGFLHEEKGRHFTLALPANPYR